MLIFLRQYKDYHFDRSHALCKISQIIAIQIQKGKNNWKRGVHTIPKHYGQRKGGLNCEEEIFS